MPAASTPCRGTAREKRGRISKEPGDVDIENGNSTSLDYVAEVNEEEIGGQCLASRELGWGAWEKVSRNQSGGGAEV